MSGPCCRVGLAITVGWSSCTIRGSRRSAIPPRSAAPFGIFTHVLGVNSYAKQAIRDGHAPHNWHDWVQEVSANRFCFHMSHLARECQAERRERGFNFGVERGGPLCFARDGEISVARPDDTYRAVRMARGWLTGGNADGTTGDASGPL